MIVVVRHLNVLLHYHIN